MVRTYVLAFSVGIATGLLVMVAGCSQPPTPSPVTAPSAAVVERPKHSVERSDDAHGHKAGAHGGAIVSLGRDSYHAEAVFEKNGAIRIYMLGKDEARIEEVEAQTLTAYVTPLAGGEAEQITFAPEPQPGDGAGKTSQFLGRLPKAFEGKTVRVTVNNLKVGTERFRAGFTNQATEGHGDNVEMPHKKPADEESKLFSTPGGLYTAADITANGPDIPTVKFKGVRAAHDAEPKIGDKVCPISETKANPKFTWVVGGKPYEFCCVPCVEEFVVKAKEKPEEVKDPDFYRKK